MTPREISRRRMLGMSTAAIGGIFLAGCSSDQKTSSNNSTSTGAPTGSSTATSSGTGAQKPAGKEILIAESAIQSGPAAASYANTQGFESYLQYVNDKGGVNGYSFKWQSRDNAYTAAQSASVQTQLIAMNPFIIFVAGSVPLTSAIPVSANANSTIPIMGLGDGALLDSLAPKAPGGLFGVVPNYAGIGRYEAQFIMDTLQDKNFALAFQNDSFAQGAADAVAKFVSAKGAKLAENLPFAASTTDFTPLVTRLKSSGAKTVLAWSVSGLAAGLQKAAAQIGYEPAWVTPFVSLTAGYLSAAGKSAEGTYIDAIWPPTDDTDNPAVKAFVDATTSYAPDAVSSSGQSGWELAAVMVEAIRLATQDGSDLTQDGFRKAIAKVKGDVELAKVDYTTGALYGATQAAMYQVKDGKFKQVAPFTDIPAAG